MNSTRMGQRKILKKKMIQIKSLEDLQIYCEGLRKDLGERAILLLKGPLGVGKTKTVEFLMRALGVDAVSSPTFTLHQEYAAHDFSVDHFDLYRIENVDDLEGCGFWDVFFKKKGWVIVEWAEKLDSELLPPYWPLLVIEMELSPENKDHRIFRETQFELLRQLS